MGRIECLGFRIEGLRGWLGFRVTRFVIVPMGPPSLQRSCRSIGVGVEGRGLRV